MNRFRFNRLQNKENKTPEKKEQRQNENSLNDKKKQVLKKLHFPQI